MSTVATLGVDIAASTEGFKKAMQDVQDQTRKVGQTLTSVGQKMSTALTLPLLGVGAASLKAASDAEETVSKFDAVFGAMAGDARAFAESHAEAVGRSRFDLMDYMSTLQDTFVPMGIARGEAAELSESITRLGIDLASFNNVAEDDAIASLTSALTGNSRAVRRFGVNLNEAALNAELMEMGIEGGTSAATEQQKVMARYNLILKATQDAQGDAVRTSDSFANQLRAVRSQLREVSVEMGQVLIPTASKVIAKVQEATAWWRDLSDGTKALIVDLGKMAALAGPLAFAIGKVTLAVRALTVAKVLLLGKVGLVVTAIAGAITLFKRFQRNAKAQGKAIDDLTERWGKNTDALNDNADARQRVISASLRQDAIQTAKLIRDVQAEIDELNAAEEADSGSSIGRTRRIAELEEELQRLKTVRTRIQAEIGRIAEAQAGGDDGDNGGVPDPDPEGNIPGISTALNAAAEAYRGFLDAIRVEDEPIVMDFDTGSILDAEREVAAARQALREATTDEERRAAQQRLEIAQQELEDRRDFMTEEEKIEEERLERKRQRRKTEEEEEEAYQERMSNTIALGMQEAADGFLNGVAQMAAGRASLGEVMSGVLDTLLSTMQKVGRIIIAAGGALKALGDALKAPFGGQPLAAIAAGGALIAIAGAARAALSSAASGGSGSGAASSVQSPRQRQQQELVARVQGRELLFLLREEEAARGR